jgi:predicted  nucleic acid-binding Zn-ribbon protein
MSISCSQCGSSFPDDFNFCLTCGKRLKEEEAAEKTPPPSAGDAARADAGAEAGSRRNPAVQERLPALSMEEDDPTLVMRVIDPGEYSALLERVQALRKAVEGLAQPGGLRPPELFRRV